MPEALRCTWCESPFSRPSPGGRLFCSTRCRDLAKAKAAEVDRTCEVCSSTFRGGPKKRYCGSDCLAAGRRKPTRTCTCKQCGQEFESPLYKGERIFCSNACKHAHGRVIRECEHCGRTESVKRSTAERGPGRRYCSWDCKFAARRNQVPVSCELCGAPFTVKPSHLDAARFCSYACKDENQRRPWVDTNCAYCDTPISLRPSQVKHGARYCSRDCVNADRNQQVTKQCELCNTDIPGLSPAQAKKRRFCSHRCSTMALLASGRMQQPSTPELALLDILSLTVGAGNYVAQHPAARRYVLDAWVPDVELVIECDGDYWHGNPAKFPNPNEQQRRSHERDAAKNTYLTDKGWTVIRFWEDEILTDPVGVAEAIEVTVDALRDNEVPEIAVGRIHLPDRVLTSAAQARSSHG